MSAIRSFIKGLKRRFGTLKRDEGPAFTRVEDRPLSLPELTLIRWLIDHGEAEGRDFAAHLEDLRVVSSCSCGCPTIDLADGCEPVKSYSPRVLADFIGHTPEGWQVGVLLHQSGGTLSELEVYNLSEHEGVFSLPDISTLAPFDSLR